MRLVSFSSSGALYEATYIPLFAFVITRLSPCVILLLPVTLHYQTCLCLCSAGMEAAVRASRQTRDELDFSPPWPRSCILAGLGSSVQ